MDKISKRIADKLLDFGNDWKRPKWTIDLKRKKNERWRNRLSPLFWKIPAYFWKKSYNFEQSKTISDKLGLPYYENGFPYVLVIPNIKHMAAIYEASERTIWGHIDRWTKQDAPFKKLCIFRPKNEGGSYVYAIGYFVQTKYGYKKIMFFNKKKYEDWYRSFLYN